jgi:hypothetical protein
MGGYSNIVFFYSKSVRQLSRSVAARLTSDAVLDTKEAPSMLQVP